MILDIIKKRYSLLLNNLEENIASGNKKSKNPLDVIIFIFIFKEFVFVGQII